MNTSPMPPPPTSSGSMNEVSPTSAARVTTSSGQCDVGLVDLGGDRADLGAGEIARERLDLALLLGQVERWWAGSAIGATLSEANLGDPASRGGVAEWLNAAVSKTVVRRLGVPRVRIPPPPLHCFQIFRVDIESGRRHNDLTLSA